MRGRRRKSDGAQWGGAGDGVPVGSAVGAAGLGTHVRVGVGVGEGLAAAAVAVGEGVQDGVPDGVGMVSDTGRHGSVTPPDEYAAGTVDWPY